MNLPFGMSARQYKKKLLKRSLEKHDFLCERGVETKKEAKTNAHKETSDLCKLFKYSKTHPEKDTGPWLVSEWLAWKEHIACKRERRVDDINSIVHEAIHANLTTDDRTTINKLIMRYGPKKVRNATKIAINYYLVREGEVKDVTFLTYKIDEICYYWANGREWKG